ncbi:hypothetical protein ACFL0T_04490 [Candidatus Omnitrophota bacterium]
MKKSTYIAALVSILLIAGLCLISADELCADDLSQHKIRVMSSKRNDRIFDDMAVDLLNGKSRFVSLDDMVKILKEYGVIQLHSEDIGPAREIILKEVAFRMLKQHYLPYPADKINVYRQQRRPSSNANVLSSYLGRNLEPSIYLPLDTATVKDNEKLKTLYWSDLVAQISTSIDKLRLNRISDKEQSEASYFAHESRLSAAQLLRRGFVQQEDIEEPLQKETDDVKVIVSAANQKLKKWIDEGSIESDDTPVIAEIVTQFIVMSSGTNTTGLISNIDSMEGVDDLRDAILICVRDTTELIQRCNPSDYAAFAMFQSLINAISSRCSRRSSDDIIDQPLTIDLKHSSSRYSA